jgi:hypothetical protein
MEKKFDETDILRTITDSVQQTKKELMKELEEKGLLKDPKPAGKTKKFLVGTGRIIGKRVDALIAEGEATIIKDQMLSAKEKARARREKELKKQLDDEFGPEE